MRPRSSPSDPGLRPTVVATAPRLLLCAALLVPAACGDDPLGVHPDAAALELAPADTLVTVGDRVALTLRILDAAGNEIDPLDGGARPEWRVSDPVIAPLLEPGIVEAAGPGEARVLVSYGDLSAEARLRVNPASVGLAIAGAYLVQSVQRLDGGVPLVAGREAVLRVFVVADRPNFFRPTVTATIHQDGAPVRAFTMAATAHGVPLEVDQGVLGWHARVPADMVRPGAGLEVVVEVDGLPVEDGSILRRPAEAGAAPLDVREVPAFRLRIVPVRLTHHQTTGRIDAGNAQSFFRFTRDIYPLAETTVDVAPVYPSEARLDTPDGWATLAQEIYALRLADPQDRYHYGAVHLPPGSTAGGYSAGGGTRAAAGSDADSGTMAHELGHAFYLPHAPCGTPGAPSYPYPDGAIGQWGFNTRTGQLYEPETRDVMGYCRPYWISDDHFRKTLDFRHANDWHLDDGPASLEPTVVVWGRVVDGTLRLEPAYELTARATLPAAPGRYRLQGLADDGATLFDLSFDPVAVPAGDIRAFLFALPVATARPDRLASLRLRGPEGDVRRAPALRPLSRRP